MKVKMLSSQYGHDVARDVGDIVEVSADEGQRMIENGLAELARGEKVERATPKNKTEKAVKKPEGGFAEKIKKAFK